MLCVDDFGNEVHACHWSGRLVAVPDILWTGPLIPGVRVRHLAAPGYEPFRKAAYRAFCESEANCNTCRHLIRVKHDKDPQGFTPGKCAMSGWAIRFHPEDPMHMRCYEAR